MALHPVITAADAHRMTAMELAFFTDAPVAQVCARLDFERMDRIDRRNREAARCEARRRREIARFLNDAADAMSRMEPA